MNKANEEKKGEREKENVFIVIRKRKVKQKKLRTKERRTVHQKYLFPNL